MPTSVEILLVRHGQSEGNRDRVFTGHNTTGLTELGRRQAEVTARAILDQALHARSRALEFARRATGDTDPGDGTRPIIDEIISSDLVRAVDTATPLARLLDIPLTLDPAVRERDVGAFTGRSFAEVESEFPDGWHALLSRDPDYAPPGGESHRATSARVAHFLDALVARRRSGRVVVYSHGVAISHMLRYVVGAPPVANPRFFFEVDNCSMHRIERLHDGVFRIVSTNETSHLAITRA